MNTETNFMSFEDLTKLIEEHKKETHPYKKYEFDSTSYTLLLISINNLIKENKKLNGAIQTYDILLKSNIEENKQLKDNWNKLKKYCKENTLCYEVGDDENTKLIGSRIHGLNVLDKMQELEQGSDNQ